MSNRATIVARCLAGALLAGWLVSAPAGAVELPATPGSTLLHHWDAFDPLGTGSQPLPGPFLGPWVDLAGTNDALLSAGPPVYNPGDVTTIGGQPSFRFTVASGFAATNAITDQSVTMFSVSKLIGGANARLITGVNPTNYLLGYWGGGEDRAFNGAFFGDNVPATTDPHMYIHEAAVNGVDTLFDGDVVITNTQGAGGATAIGNLGFGGVNWSANEASNGDISEIIIFDSNMPQEDFDAVGLYLAQKYGFEAFGHDGTVIGGGPGGGGGGGVPEPASIAMWMIVFAALASLAIIRRCKQRSAAV